MDSISVNVAGNIHSIQIDLLLKFLTAVFDRFVGTKVDFVGSGEYAPDARRD
jgi:hypothetical protein